MDFNELTADQKAKVKACKTPEELLALAKSEGYELSDAELEGLAGGGFWDGNCEDYQFEDDGTCPSAWHA